MAAKKQPGRTMPTRVLLMRSAQLIDDLQELVVRMEGVQSAIRSLVDDAETLLTAIPVCRAADEHRRARR